MRGAVLAGGEAMRFGGNPKGLERVGGVRILDRVVDVVATATGSAPLLVANAPDAVSWRTDLKVTADVMPGCGTLGGIYTAVTAGEGPVLVVGWDMPFLTTPLLTELLRGSTGYDAFLPEGGGPRMIEPLCGVYHARCAPAIRARLEQGDFRAIAFHDAVRVGILPRAQVERYGSIAELFFNINAPADLERAEETWRRRHE